MKITKNELKKLSLSLYFELDDNQLEKLCAESEHLLSQLEKLAYIDVAQIAPMYYPHGQTTSVLRADEPHAISKPNSYLENAHEQRGKYVVVK